MGSKQPVSVLVVIHSKDGQALLMERADKPGYWQSVTGSREGGEALIDTARREVAEETGLDIGAGQLSDWGIVNRYEIYPHWRHRYPEGVTHNDEHVFGLLLDAPRAVTLAPREHLAYRWLRWDEAAALAFSPSNAEALRLLPGRLGLPEA
ncbi:dihydroneopterin triphosphate diphosphatase [Chromobacterium subtsugae]|uniref:Dihydroneopterin triphosphate diphosphatase n=1 Tax=Chromobacterium subtsugae TaxID=251747 RepID=A0ABS7FCL7_9NEIS|nr:MULTISPECIES: dihydroneopterin triphosphate diphosphatase [Chromobacterium]KUM03022.1 dihydroneopterin triphosphate pyrophosphatase [Chromobacterium subtsugae]KZE85981.1 dihydroneopterin triphosphate diphosphatase [Chromobacterium sp. F49]MBW7567355.1 dihydroneopterin triphosphate diphosphatase [Chromobacterium subtsugae]MBW8287521.1 dihydroneopterin triphosphate diphosphatase [Chromobacterium subtsugae]WSE93476.1 dihydroneopterin triphosphate diphosphatase [Chromobacterium subtsugae]